MCFVRGNCLGLTPLCEISHATDSQPGAAKNVTTPSGLMFYCMCANFISLGCIIRIGFIF
jgi:hypothetical protein